MSALWTHTDAAAATGGQAVGAWSVNGLSIDTRSLQEGQLFVPLKDIRDGHDFIPMALEKGAGAVMSEHPISDAPALIVADSLKALEDLAIAARKRSSATRIAITGSVGKTSVKEMVAHICRAAGKIHNSIKSFNNHWGVPFTLAGMAQDTEYGVFEMGMNHAGELAHLAKIVMPEIAVITKIAPAHLAHFDSVKDIATAKMEIFSSMQNGVVILPRDNEFYDYLNAGHRRMTKSFGSSDGADAQILQSRQTPQGSVSGIHIAGKEYIVKLPMAGAHWVENAACALLITHCAGIDLGNAVKSLENMYKIQGRGEVHDLNIAGKSITLIDESYNANPESMSAAIAVLGLNKGRKIAVLGDMFELGDGEAALHARLLEPLQRAGVDQVITCGERMKNLNDVLSPSMNAGWFSDHAECISALKKTVQNGDTIMIKGSNASGMGKLVVTLKKQKTKRGHAHAL